MQQLFKPRYWKNIIDTMSVQVAKLSVSKPIRNISEVSKSNSYTRDGHFPYSRVYTSNGSIFIGSYTDNKWCSESVKPYWEEIRNTRGNYGNYVISKNKTTRTKIKRESRKLTKITSQVEQIEVKHKVAQLEVSVGYDGTSIIAASTARTNVSSFNTGTD